jgi:hypothetical protein
VVPLNGASERLSIASLIRHSDSLIHVDLLSPVSAEELRTAAPRKAVYHKGGQASAAGHQNPEQLRIEAAGGAPLRVLRVQSRRLNAFGVSIGLSPSWGAFDRHRSPFLPAMSMLSSPSGELSNLGHKLIDLDANLEIILAYDDGVTSHTAFGQGGRTCTDLQLAYASCRNLDPEGGGSARKFTSTPLPLAAPAAIALGLYVDRDAHTLLEDVERLEALRERGTITDDEFLEQKRRLLG